MQQAAATAKAAIQRLDYHAPAYWIDTVELTFDLDPAKSRVLNKMRLRRNPDVPAQALRLDGEGLNLARVLVNGSGTSFKLDGEQLVLENPVWPLRQPEHLLHPMRGRGLPPHHLLPRPPRCHGQLQRVATR